MTPEEEQAAKSSVEAALYGWVEPNAEDLEAFAEAEEVKAESHPPLVSDFLAVGDGDDYVGRATLSGE